MLHHLHCQTVSSLGAPPPSFPLRSRRSLRLSDVRSHAEVEPLLGEVPRIRLAPMSDGPPRRPRTLGVWDQGEQHRQPPGFQPASALQELGRPTYCCTFTAFQVRTGFLPQVMKPPLSGLLVSSSCKGGSKGNCVSPSSWVCVHSQYWCALVNSCSSLAVWWLT